MAVCIVIFILLLLWRVFRRRWNRKAWLSPNEAKKVWRVLFFCNLIAFALFLVEEISGSTVEELIRNPYGEGSRVEKYEVSIEGEVAHEVVEVEVQEREYSETEIQVIFEEIMRKLDQEILGENQSFDHIEQNLNLPDSLKGYPVDIRWEFSNYEVLDAEGHVVEDMATSEGTLVEIRGILTYLDYEAVYTANCMVYAETKVGAEKWLDLLENAIAALEQETRQNKTLPLPKSIDGKKVEWRKPKDTRGYYILMFGAIGAGLLVWNTRQEKKEARQRRLEQMERDYPNIVSKAELLLTTGMTVKQVWLKIVQAYEAQKEQHGIRHAYEEMKVTCNEMQGGIAEAESYERFGMRCQSAMYMKFGALLSQNLRKGSKGLSELLRMEGIQAFEIRKGTAKRKGEEAGAKLMLPMMGMLAVVMLMVIVPAFLSLQI